MAIAKSALILLQLIVFWGQSSQASLCSAESAFGQSPLFQELNAKLLDPDFKVIVLGRHGKASQENKFPAVERNADPEKMRLDIARPLAKKGQRAATQLSEVMSLLQFREAGMWGSYALRVESTARYTRDVLGERVKIYEFEQDLYYADVPAEMEQRLASEQGEALPHAFFWGHGKTTLALFKKLTGATDGFLPTAAVMIVAMKAGSWEQVFSGGAEQVEAYAWSPNKSHEIIGSAAPVSMLESAGPELESVGGLESGMDLELFLDDDDEGFDPTEDGDSQSLESFVLR
ncbi:MAG: hypothetical protein AAF202_02265 [Pseudomonadota bacterium]